MFPEVQTHIGTNIGTETPRLPWTFLMFPMFPDVFPHLEIRMLKENLSHCEYRTGDESARNIGQHRERRRTLVPSRPWKPDVAPDVPCGIGNIGKLSRTSGHEFRTWRRAGVT